MKLLLLITLTLLLAPSIIAKPAYIQERHNGRAVVLIVQQETAKRLKAGRLTDGDREELQAARRVALGFSETRISCITGAPELAHADVERWGRCPVQNIRR